MVECASDGGGDEGTHSLFRPFAFQGVAAMKPEDASKLEEDKRKIVALGCELIDAAQKARLSNNLLPQSSNDDSFFSTSTASQQTIMSHGNISLQSLATMFPQVSQMIKHKIILTVASQNSQPRTV